MKKAPKRYKRIRERDSDWKKVKEVILYCGVCSEDLGGDKRWDSVCLKCYEPIEFSAFGHFITFLRTFHDCGVV